METVSLVQLVLRLTWVKHAVGMCMEFMTFIAAGGWNFERIFFGGFFWRLIQEEDSAIIMNIQVAIV